MWHSKMTSHFVMQLYFMRLSGVLEGVNLSRRKKNSSFLFLFSNITTQILSGYKNSLFIPAHQYHSLD